MPETGRLNAVTSRERKSSGTIIDGYVAFYGDDGVSGLTPIYDRRLIPLVQISRLTIAYTHTHFDYHGVCVDSRVENSYVEKRALPENAQPYEIIDAISPPEMVCAIQKSEVAVFSDGRVFVKPDFTPDEKTNELILRLYRGTQERLKGKT